MISPNFSIDALGVVLDYAGSSAVPIGPRHAITAAHTGTAPRLDGICPRMLAQRTVHPTKDLAILHLAEGELDFSRWHPVCSRQIKPEGELCVMGGYGQVGPPGGPIGFPRRPMWGTNYVRSSWMGWCSTQFDDRDTMPGDVPGTPFECQWCMNDSGGPLLVYGSGGRLELAGVAVAASGLDFGGYSYAERLYEALPWIDEVIGTADTNGDGVVTDADFWAFLSRWHDVRGFDINGDGRSTIQDLFDFLAWWRRRKI